MLKVKVAIDRIIVQDFKISLFSKLKCNELELLSKSKALRKHFRQDPKTKKPPHPSS